MNHSEDYLTLLEGINTLLHMAHEKDKDMAIVTLLLQAKSKVINAQEAKDLDMLRQARDHIVEAQELWFA